MNMEKYKNNEVQVLVFATDACQQATVVTDGERTKSFEFGGARDHRSLKSAIAYLECRGYHILTEEGWR